MNLWSAEYTPNKVFTEAIKSLYLGSALTEWHQKSDNHQDAVPLPGKKNGVGVQKSIEKVEISITH